MAYTLVFRRYAPFASFAGFEGDVRTEPSTSMDATARTIGTVPFAPGQVGTVSKGSSGTQITMFGGAVARLIGTRHSNVASSVTVQTATIDSVRFTALTSGANPMFGPAAPAIDTFIDVHAVFRGAVLELSGTVRGDNFPNAEVFVLDEKGNGTLLFSLKTDGGQNTGPFTRLWGEHAKQVLGTFRLAIPVDAAGLFK